ncbi:unnamed protein product [Orchesella dallaii]|uniref:Gustatory receptor n=1 Tax=Orchesella dallaii TaxID=48710 RepID=A0ABP1RFF4_9HEXA
MKTFKTKVGYFNEEIPIHFVQFSEIISSVKPFFNVSRIFGIPSFSVIENVVSKGGILTFFGLLNIFLLINQIFLFVMRLTRGEDFFKISGPFLLMRLHVIFVHIWCIFYSRKLATALRSSLVVENRINKVYNGKTVEFIPPWLLRRKCLIWTALFVIVGLGITFKTFPIDILLGQVSAGEAWESYGEMCGLNKELFLLPSVTSAYCLFMEIATNFVWLFGDFFLVILSIIMSEMFSRINTRGIKRVDPTHLTSIEIDLIREHHGVTAKLVKEFDDAIAALNLISLVFNVAFLVVGAYSVFTLKSRERRRMTAALTKLYCKLIVAAIKLASGLIAASVLHHKAHQAIAEVRSWPMAREFQDFSINNGRASVIHAFLAQLSKPSIGFTIGKLATITPKLLALTALGVGIFFAFARITISSCSRGSSRS